jgi:hypothetical protein
VHFTKVRVDLNGAISADGHNLDLYGAALMRGNEICNSRAGVRWACGQRAFMALRGLADGKAITCTFKHENEPPKAVCLVGDSNVAEALLSGGGGRNFRMALQTPFTLTLRPQRVRGKQVFGEMGHRDACRGNTHCCSNAH